MRKAIKMKKGVVMNMIKFGGGLVLLGALNVSVTFAQVVYYNTDFSDSGTGANAVGWSGTKAASFSFDNTNWSVVNAGGGVNALHWRGANIAPGGAFTTNMTNDLDTPFVAADGFVVSTSFKVGPVSGWTNDTPANVPNLWSVGFAAMGNSANTVSGATGYFACVTNGGNFSIGSYSGQLRNNRTYAGGTTANENVGFGGFNTTSTYTMTLTGAYLSESVLELTLWLSDGSEEWSLTGTTRADLTGDYFGLLELFGSAPKFGSTLGVNYYDFSVMSAIPEPSTWLLLGCGGVLLGFLRRRKA